MFSTNHFLRTIAIAQMAAALFASVEEIDTFDKILPEIDAHTLVLLDVDETLIEMPMMLGGKAWRQYAKKVIERSKFEGLAEEIHDELTYFLCKRVSYLPVEKTTAGHVKALQERGVLIFGLTARGKYHWYDLAAPDAQELTFLHLRQAGFDFSENEKAPLQEPHWSFAGGVFFAYPIESKGDLVLELFEKTALRPSKVVFVDDKLAHVRDVDAAFEKLHIASKCYYYPYVDVNRSFDPMTAHIQLEKLVFHNQLFSDAEAAALKNQYPDNDPDSFFLTLVDKIFCHEKTLLRTSFEPLGLLSK